MGGRGSSFSKQKHGTPRNNRVQNRQTNAVKKQFKMTKSGGRYLHEEISHRNMSFHEILQVAEDMTGYRKGKEWTRNSRRR